MSSAGERVRLGLTGDLGELDDGGADLLDLLVAKFNGLDHLLFRNFLRTGLDHHDAIHGAGDGDVDQAALALGVGGVHDKLIVDKANTHRTNWTVEGHIRQRKSAGRAVDGDDVRIVFLVRRVDEGNDLRPRCR